MLQGVVGSHAYGLNHADSDEDRLGIYVAPTQDILGLFAPKDTITSSEEDRVYHELGKYVSLALKANPTVLELIFLGNYEIQTQEGERICEIRRAFLSKAVENSYGGYAKQQFERLKRRGDFSSTLKKRTAKHALHMARLLEQGKELKTTGDLEVRVRDPEKLREVSRMSVEEMIEWFPDADSDFRNSPSVLPDEPNYDIVNEFLLDVRKAHWS